MASNDFENDPSKMSKKDRREHLREVARIRRAEELKRKKRNRILTQIGVVVGALAVVALVVTMIVNANVEANRPGPQNMASDGILFTNSADAQVVPVSTPATAAGEKPTPTKPDADKTNIVIYLDYLCPLCKQFEEANIAGLKDMVGAGDATLEIHPISLLDRFAAGTKYSTRSAAAMACVANYAPDSFLDASAALFAAAPQENTAGPNDSVIAQTFKDAGINDAQVATCVTDGEFRNWVDASTKRVLDGPLPNTDVEKVTGTPTILVNGEQYGPTKGTGWGDSNDFFAFVAKVAAQ
ncbi:DsbA family protein [Mycetocola spongiae]|uniref:DsbA family protein n=1 Tax=Mycetocola spongiae TaxID=2859226 RepID=UPI001CF40833|nr:thioredoxin domain-containing protein [Mycetocola spongiae]UCR88215.1 DsbA family protein [Mycetocola spongiae]